MGDKMPDPYCQENEGHRCIYSPTGWCRAETVTACASAKGCVMPTGATTSAEPVAFLGIPAEKRER
jgi:hypothetical protein